MADDRHADAYADQAPPRFDLDTSTPAPAAQRLANVDQLPVYRPDAPGGSLQIPDLMPIVAKEIEGEANKELLIYLHVPFCRYKCSFCDWVADIPTRQLTSGPEARQVYVDAMCRQIQHLGPALMRLGYVPRHIYWGGGTPSRLEGGQFRQIVRTLGEAMDLSTVQEHVMEVTPDSLTIEKLEAIKDVGVSRISMGVQSFNSVELRQSGRGHSPEEADQAVAMLRQTGFDNFNIDLIIAFPDQTADMLQHSLDCTVGHQPKHVTAYVYRPTPATNMAQRHKKSGKGPIGEAHMAACYERTRRAMLDNGYGEYTLGYFSRSPGDRCAGEMYYFHLQGDWVGFGGGAVSVLGHHRLKNAHGNLHRFIDDPLTFDSCERLPGRQVEAAIYALRQALVTNEGVNYANFRRFFGFPFHEVRDHPAIRAFIGYYKYCGAVFQETDTRLSITPQSRAAAYMKVWAKAGTPPGVAPPPPDAML